MFSKLGDFFTAFKSGEIVVNPTAWKRGQVSTTVLTAFLLALLHIAKAYGYGQSIDEEVVTQFAGGLLVVINSVITVVSTTKPVLGGSISSDVREEQPFVPSVQPSVEDSPREAITELQEPVQTIDQATIQAATEYVSANNLRGQRS